MNNTVLTATIVLAGVAISGLGILLALILIALALIALFFWRRERLRQPLRLSRLPQNPILAPDPSHWWESAAVFNPAAVYHDGRVHLFYRALGGDGVSRIGHASSADGIHFDERSPFPVYDRGPGFEEAKTVRTRRKLSYDTDQYASGGGWGGCEDPRAVKIDEQLYMSFGIFEAWESMRLAITSLPLKHLELRAWMWEPHIVISPKNETHKNWMLFPEKIGGKFAILHALTPRIHIEYVDSLEGLRDNPIKSNNHRTGRAGSWDAFVRGASAPPVKTKDGWLLFYHGMDPAEGHIGYKVGAMLLDLNDPTRILYRSAQPVLEPAEWYENDWKPGVVYASGAVVLGDELFVYYGGGDKYIAAAKANLHDFVRKLRTHQHAQLRPIAIQ